MATTISSAPISPSDLSLVWRTQYVSEALNRKFTPFPRGFVRGFRPVAGAGNDTIELHTDDLLNESVANLVGIQPSYQYALTYRVTSTLTLDLSSLPAGRYYVAVLHDYTVSNQTNGEWRAYTEAEFEAGQIETDGAVFAFAVETTGNVSPLTQDKILLAGRSTGTQRPFAREESWDFFDDGGHRRLVLDWQPEPIDASPTMGVSGSDAFDATDYLFGAGSLNAATSGTIAANLPRRIRDRVIPVWMDPSATERPKVILQLWYKLDAGYSGSFEPNIEFLDEAGAVITDAKSENAAGRAPTWEPVPSTGPSAGWEMIRWECQVPDPANFGGSRAVAFRVAYSGTGTITPGLRLWPMQVWVEGERSSYDGAPSPEPPGGLGAVVTRALLLSGSAPAIPSAGDYWLLDASGADLLIQPKEVSSATARTIVFGDDTYSGAQTFEFKGALGSTFVFRNLQLQANVFPLEVRAIGGGDTAVLDVNRLQQSDTFTYSTGPSGSVSGDTPVANNLYAGAQIKAWGVISSDGAGGYSCDKGFNVANVTNITGEFKVDLLTPMADANYAVIVTMEGTGTHYAQVTTIGTSSFRIRVYDGTGAFNSVATNALKARFIVVGEQ